MLVHPPAGVEGKSLLEGGWARSIGVEGHSHRSSIVLFWFAHGAWVSHGPAFPSGQMLVVSVLAGGVVLLL